MNRLRVLSLLSATLFGCAHARSVPPSESRAALHPSADDRVHGLVQDAKTGQPVSAAVVTLHYADRSYGDEIVVSDDRGEFSFPLDRGNVISLEVEKEGYTPLRSHVMPGALSTHVLLAKQDVWGEPDVSVISCHGPTVDVGSSAQEWHVRPEDFRHVVH